MPGKEVHSLPKEVDELYDEVRRCISISAHTAVAMVCRKMLMCIAVEKGAEDDKDFLYYVDFLTKNHLTAEQRKWVEGIRNAGNMANHEIKPVTSENADKIYMCTAFLLKLLYELPAMVPDFSEQKGKDND